MKYCIVMPTRDRQFRLEKCLPAWIEQDLPIFLITEPNQVIPTNRWLREMGWAKEVRAVSQGAAGRGIGYARKRAMLYSHRANYGAVIMADDDITPKGDVRELLRFVAEGRAMGCAGWMPNYGLWVPDGNKIAKEPGLVVPMTGGPDRIFALNVRLTMLAGNFDERLDVLYENSEINRAGVNIGYLWYVHSSVHIKMLGKRNDPGGIVAHAGSLEQRLAREKNCHAVVHSNWPDYVSSPEKRYMCRWRNLIRDRIGPAAVERMDSRAAAPATEERAFVRAKSQRR